MSIEDKFSISKQVSGVYGQRIRLALWVAGGFSLFCIGFWIVVSVVKDDFSTKTGYLVVQMLFSNGDAGETNVEALKWLRLGAPWVLPLLGVYAFVAALRVRFGFFLNSIFRRRRELVLVIGLGEKGLEMVRAELEEGEGVRDQLTKKISVVVIESDADNPHIIQAETEGATVWLGDARSIGDLKAAAWKRPRRIWIMTGDSNNNLLILDTVRKAFERSNAPHLDVYALVPEHKERRDAMRLTTLNRDSDDFWTHLFNQEEAQAEWLIRQNPVRWVNGEPPRILLVGLGSLGRAIFRELLLLCHHPDAQPFSADSMPHVTMVDSVDFSQTLQNELPFLSRTIKGVSPFVQWRSVNEDAQSWSFEHYCEHIRQEKSFTHVFICMGSEVRNLSLAERILGWEVLLESSMPRIVPVVYDNEASDWCSFSGSASTNVRIHPFMVGSIYSQKANKWRNETLRDMAKRINHVYELATGDPENEKDLAKVWIERLDVYSREGGPWAQKFMEQALKSSAVDDVVKRRTALEERAWQGATEDDRRSSLVQARYLFNRFHRDIESMDDHSQSSWRSTLARPSALDLELEARCEHRRWSASMLVENFSHIPVRDLMDRENWTSKSEAKIQTSSDRSSTKEPEEIKVRKIARVNSNLISFDDLSDRFKRIDLHIVAAHEWIKKGDQPLAWKDVQTQKL